MSDRNRGGTTAQASEAQRLQALHSYGILDTAPERAFDEIAATAGQLCDTPIALISFVDENRQWFKARVGLTTEETPRSMAFCAHTILQGHVLEVPDARLDSRFAETPLVTGEPHIAFYAGAPITTPNGHRLGTVCVIDQAPRTLSDMQTSALELLRDAVMRELEIRRLRKAVDEKIVKVCAWCARVHVSGEEAGWIAADEYVRRAYPISHGMCPNCVSEQEPH